MDFKEKLDRATQRNNSLVCVGLDLDFERIPLFLKESYPKLESLYKFAKSIIDATSDLVCSYKPNIAFYEALGKKGLELLNKIIDYIPDEIPVILDAKRNDIGNTARMYAKAVFDEYRADAVTVNPYLGKDSVQPFLDYADKCTFILCRSSNPSAKDFQDLRVGSKPLYQLVARKIKDWNSNNNCGAVVGATYPEEIGTVRKLVGDEIPLLIPGLGVQRGALSDSVKNGVNKNNELAIFNSSRSILFASVDKNFSEVARKATLKLRNKINSVRFGND
ncbi:MAG TPA: orotidine-5'-phosphate decarboxylase [Thermoplasmata archaeon]|nr:orotidine-5'-phosphate decarboxylase [Thermoplasmata archaeon]